MISYCKMRIVQVIETIRQNSIKKLLRETIYLDREAVPVAIDLAALRPLEDFVHPSDERLTEITPEMISRQSIRYPIKSRFLKAASYLNDGYRGFALVNGDAVSGDIWCASAVNPKDGRKHPDEAWLSIRCEKGEVYTFDMYVNPEKRGWNLAAALQNGALHELGKEGFSRAYGFFWADNIAALWVHRTLRWQELDRVQASRFVLSRKFRVGMKTRRGA